MAKKTVKELVEEMASPIVENLGLELVEVKYAKGFSGMELTLFIHSPSGITLEDCERVSRAIDEPLDELNPTKDEPYSLNVSSLGLDRPIKTERDAKRNLGKKIDVKLFAPKDGKKIWTGVLTDCSNEKIEIEIDGKKLVFKFAEIAQATPVIDF